MFTETSRSALKLCYSFEKNLIHIYIFIVSTNGSYDGGRQGGR